MNKTMPAFLIFFLIIFVVCCYAEDSDPVTVSPESQAAANPPQTMPSSTPGAGMDVISIRGLNIAVPRGMKIEDKGSYVVIEDMSSYLDRRFDAVDKRLTQIEDMQEDLRQGLEEVTDTLNNTKKEDAR